MMLVIMDRALDIDDAATAKKFEAALEFASCCTDDPKTRIRIAASCLQNADFILHPPGAPYCEPEALQQAFEEYQTGVKVYQWHKARRELASRGACQQIP